MVRLSALLVSALLALATAGPIPHTDHSVNDIAAREPTNIYPSVGFKGDPEEKVKRTNIYPSVGFKGDPEEKVKRTNIYPSVGFKGDPEEKVKRTNIYPSVSFKGETDADAE